MPAAVRRIVMHSLGWMFILLGFIGLFLPILQGFLFFGIGLIILSRESEWVRGRIDWLRNRWPWFRRLWDGTEHKASRMADWLIHRRRRKRG